MDKISVPDDFLRGDETHEYKRGQLRRNLTFATDQQIRLLKKARVLYIDGTFKLVGGIFYQLYTFHCFIKDGDHKKQVVVGYIVMMGKSYKDYLSVSIIIDI